VIGERYDEEAIGDNQRADTRADTYVEA